MSQLEELNEQVKNRQEKVRKLREMGFNPYRNDFKPTVSTQNIKDHYHWAPSKELDAEGQPIMKAGRELSNKMGSERFSIAGRVIFLRSFGKAMFIHLRDREGELQVYLSKNDLGEDVFSSLKLVEVGDILGVSGGVFLTKTKELTLHATQAVLLTKSTQPLPEKFHGLTNVETRYRQRYVDLISNPEVADVFRKRTRIVQLIRSYLEKHQFMEVETPMLHPLVGGAAARPFETHHNTLNRDLYLRIAPELYLKRLLVGGFERVYEINRSFRNEGVSTRHNPEFTMLEFYWAYATYEDLIPFTEKMISSVATEVCGSTSVCYQGTGLDFSTPWNRLTMNEAIVQYWNQEREEKIELSDIADAESLLLFLGKHFGEGETQLSLRKMSYGEQIGWLFEEIAEEHLIQPTFITHFPTEISPLARKNEKDERFTDRFEIFVYGRELGNAFSELNDPEDQKQRFQNQVDKKSEGMDETMDFDEDYICALEYGMPPAAGEGIGIDRLCMILCDAPSIRDVIFFPQLKN